MHGRLNRISAQFKPAKPIVLKRGRTLKYLSPLGQPNHIDVHPRNREQIRDTSVPLWITEGIKKGDSLATRDCCVATLTGVFNWRSRLGTLGDWEDVPLKGRTVFLCFDADAKKNMNVARAMVRLGRWCRSKGASVRYLIVPAEVNNTATKGVDDYFAAGGTIDALTAASTTDEPEAMSCLVPYVGIKATASTLGQNTNPGFRKFGYVGSSVVGYFETVLR